MGERNREVEVVLAELDKYGLKGRVEPRGKHLEIRWEYKGHSRFVIAAATASDRRAWLNLRAQTRRELRTMGVERPTVAPVSLARALSLPRPEDSGPARLAELELNFEALLDMFTDVQLQLAAARSEVELLNRRMSSARVVFDLVETPAAALVEKPSTAAVLPAAPTLALPSTNVVQLVQAASGRNNPSQKILAAFEQLSRDNGRDWQSVDDLRSLTGIESQTLGSTLYYLSKNRGLVENGQRGWWRRKPVETVQQALHQE